GVASGWEHAAIAERLKRGESCPTSAPGDRRKTATAVTAGKVAETGISHCTPHGHQPKVPLRGDCKGSGPSGQISASYLRTGRRGNEANLPGIARMEKIGVALPAGTADMIYPMACTGSWQKTPGSQATIRIRGLLVSRYRRL